MHLLVVGLDQRSAPLDLRERCRWPEEETGAALARSRDAGLSEAALLCTCNRTEFYGVADDPAAAALALTDLLAERTGAPVADVQPHLYRHVGAPDTAAHLFRVACGLESLVLGETQVLGQVKQAYLRSAEVGTVGKVLHGLFHHALACGKAVHAGTGLASAPVSVGAAAVEMAQRDLGGLEGRRAVVVGAGETADIVARRLREGGLASLVVVNRGRERGQALAGAVGAEAAGLDGLPELLGAADVVVTSTASGRPLLGRAAVERVMAARAGRPLLIIDIAVPRDVDPDAAGVLGVHLVNIDDLEGIAAAGRAARGREALAAADIIDEQVRDFSRWVRGQDAVPLIRALGEHFAGVASAESDRLLRQLPDLRPDQAQAVRRMAHRIAASLANGPIQHVRRMAGEPGGQDAVRALATAFGLDLPAVTGLPTPDPAARASGH